MATKTEVRTPEEIIAELAPAYTEWKGGEKSKEKLKKEFFEAITEYLAAEGNQAEDLIQCEASSPEAAQEYALKKRPGWVIEDWREDPDHTGIYEVIVKEDPAFQAFTIEHDGKVWGRQISAGSTFVDTDRLEEEDTDLWMEVTAYPNEDFLSMLVYEAGKEISEIGPYIMQVAERYDIERQLVDLNTLDPETLAKLQPYVFEGKPVVKLPAPKKAES